MEDLIDLQIGQLYAEELSPLHTTKRATDWMHKILKKRFRFAFQNI